MAGIDNITNEILQEAENKAAAMSADARKRAEDLLDGARKKCEDIAAKGTERGKAEAEAYASRVVSQAGLRKRQALLKAKQDIISDVIDKAMEKLASRETGDYFAMLIKLVGAHLQKGDGEILFSKRDLERLPKGFPEEAAKLAEAAGGSLTVSKETADIENGFILRYGGVDENCTLKALFAEKRDILSDTVAKTLWHKENTDG